MILLQDYRYGNAKLSEKYFTMDYTLAVIARGKRKEIKREYHRVNKLLRDLEQYMIEHDIETTGELELALYNLDLDHQMRMMGWSSNTLKKALEK